MTTPPARTLTVVDPGMLTTVQDDGRAGYAHLGVPRSGWLDPVSAGLANRLVGNPPDAAVLECLLGGLALEAGSAVTVAVTGAACTVWIQGRGDGRHAAHGSAVSVAAGQRVVLGRVTRGARCYVAVSGGIAVPPVLGSRSTDTLSGLGPPRLTVGTVLPVGPVRGAPSDASAVARDPGEPAALRIRRGPRTDWFTGDALGRLCTAAYVVAPDSNRVALRLRGPTLSRTVPGELPSEGLVLGAVQVPADGQPVVFLRDHPTTGGYPVVAVVELGDLDRCAQLLAGDAVTFRQPHPHAATGGGRDRRR
ncbi:MAG: hypothetical protein QOK15_13 [Nocardioidaceae bacterium]|nr:hypothetical protein [Nocardioidaceae bacterium]